MPLSNVLLITQIISELVMLIAQAAETGADVTDEQMAAVMQSKAAANANWAAANREAKETGEDEGEVER